MSEKFDEYWNIRHSESEHSGYLIDNPIIGRQRLRYESSIVERLLKNTDLIGKDVLDLACGNGFISTILAKAGANVTACDLSHSVIEQNRRSKQHQNITWVVSDAANFIKDNHKTYELIYVGGLAPYLDDVEFMELVEFLAHQRKVGAKIIWREIFSYNKDHNRKFTDSDGIARSISDFSKANFKLSQYNYGYLFQPVSLKLRSDYIHERIFLLTVAAVLLRLYRRIFRSGKNHRNCGFFIL